MKLKEVKQIAQKETKVKSASLVSVCPDGWYIGTINNAYPLVTQNKIYFGVKIYLQITAAEPEASAYIGSTLRLSFFFRSTNNGETSFNNAQGLMNLYKSIWNAELDIDKAPEDALEKLTGHTLAVETQYKYKSGSDYPDQLSAINIADSSQVEVDDDKALIMDSVEVEIEHEAPTNARTKMVEIANEIKSTEVETSKIDDTDIPM